MGNVNYTLHHFVGGNCYIVRWASLSTSSGAADVGQAFPASTDLAMLGGLFSDKSVQVFRPAGSTCQVLIRGSNHPTAIASFNMVFSTLSDPQGNALQIPASGVTNTIEAILENCLYISPLVSTVSSTSEAATVDLLFSSVRSSRSGV